MNPNPENNPLDEEYDPEVVVQSTVDILTKIKTALDKAIKNNASSLLDISKDNFSELLSEELFQDCKDNADIQQAIAVVIENCKLVPKVLSDSVSPDLMQSLNSILSSVNISFNSFNQKYPNLSQNSNIESEMEEEREQGVAMPQNQSELEAQNFLIALEQDIGNVKNLSAQFTLREAFKNTLDEIDPNKLLKEQEIIPAISTFIANNILPITPPENIQGVETLVTIIENIQKQFEQNSQQPQELKQGELSDDSIEEAKQETTNQEIENLQIALDQAKTEIERLKQQTTSEKIKTEKEINEQIKQRQDLFEQNYLQPLKAFQVKLESFSKEIPYAEDKKQLLSELKKLNNEFKIISQKKLSDNARAAFPVEATLFDTLTKSCSTELKKIENKINKLSQKNVEKQLADLKLEIDVLNPTNDSLKQLAQLQQKNKDNSAIETTTDLLAMNIAKNMVTKINQAVFNKIPKEPRDIQSFVNALKTFSRQEIVSMRTEVEKILSPLHGTEELEQKIIAEITEQLTQQHASQSFVAKNILRASTLVQSIYKYNNDIRQNYEANFIQSLINFLSTSKNEIKNELNEALLLLTNKELNNVFSDVISNREQESGRLSSFYQPFKTLQLETKEDFKNEFSKMLKAEKAYDNSLLQEEIKNRIDADRLAREIKRVQRKQSKHQQEASESINQLNDSLIKLNSSSEDVRSKISQSELTRQLTLAKSKVEKLLPEEKNNEHDVIIKMAEKFLNSQLKAEKQKILDEHAKKVNELQSQLDAEKQRADNAEKFKPQDGEELQALQQQLASVQAEKNKIEKDMQQLQASITANEKATDALKAQLTTNANNEEEIENLNKQIKKLTDENENLKSKLENSRGRIIVLTDEATELKFELYARDLYEVLKRSKKEIEHFDRTLTESLLNQYSGTEKEENTSVFKERIREFQSRNEKSITSIIKGINSYKNDNDYVANKNNNDNDHIANNYIQAGCENLIKAFEKQLTKIENLNLDKNIEEALRQYKLLHPVEELSEKDKKFIKNQEQVANTISTYVVTEAYNNNEELKIDAVSNKRLVHSLGRITAPLVDSILKARNKKSDTLINAIATVEKHISSLKEFSDKNKHLEIYIKPIISECAANLGALIQAEYLKSNSKNVDTDITTTDAKSEELLNKIQQHLKESETFLQTQLQGLPKQVTPEEGNVMTSEIKNAGETSITGFDEHDEHEEESGVSNSSGEEKQKEQEVMHVEGSVPQNMDDIFNRDVKFGEMDAAAEDDYIDIIENNLKKIFENLVLLRNDSQSLEKNVLKDKAQGLESADKIPTYQTELAKNRARAQEIEQEYIAVKAEYDNISEEDTSIASDELVSKITNTKKDVDAVLNNTQKTLDDWKKLLDDLLKNIKSKIPSNDVMSNLSKATDISGILPIKNLLDALQQDATKFAAATSGFPTDDLLNIAAKELIKNIAELLTEVDNKTAEIAKKVDPAIEALIKELNKLKEEFQQKDYPSLPSELGKEANEFYRRRVQHGFAANRFKNDTEISKIINSLGIKDYESKTNVEKNIGNELQQIEGEINSPIKTDTLDKIQQLENNLSKIISNSSRANFTPQQLEDAHIKLDAINKLPELDQEFKKIQQDYENNISNTFKDEKISDIPKFQEKLKSLEDEKNKLLSTEPRSDKEKEFLQLIGNSIKNMDTQLTDVSKEIDKLKQEYASNDNHGTEVLDDYKKEKQEKYDKAKNAIMNYKVAANSNEAKAQKLKGVLDNLKQGEALKEKLQEHKNSLAIIVEHLKNILEVSDTPNDIKSDVIRQINEFLDPLKNAVILTNGDIQSLVDIPQNKGLKKDSADFLSGIDVVKEELLEKARAKQKKLEDELAAKKPAKPLPTPPKKKVETDVKKTADEVFQILKIHKAATEAGMPEFLARRKLPDQLFPSSYKVAGSNTAAPTTTNVQAAISFDTNLATLGQTFSEKEIADMQTATGLTLVSGTGDKYSLMFNADTNTATAITTDAQMRRLAGETDAQFAERKMAHMISMTMQIANVGSNFRFFGSNVNRLTGAMFMAKLKELCAPELAGLTIYLDKAKQESGDKKLFALDNPASVEAAKKECTKEVYDQVQAFINQVLTPKNLTAIKASTWYASLTEHATTPAPTPPKPGSKPIKPGSAKFTMDEVKKETPEDGPTVPPLGKSH